MFFPCNFFSQKYLIKGNILTKEYHQLSYLSWLEKDFSVRPEAQSHMVDAGEPAESTKFSFSLFED